MSDAKNQRDSNIEALRIILMLMIIAHHFVVHGGSAWIGDWSINHQISLAILPLGKIGFTCFIAISSYYLVKSSFKARRFLKIWLETLFYSVIFTIVAFIFGKDLTIYNWVSVFFPIFGNTHGFAATYLAFYLLLPLLLLINKKLNDNQLLYFGTLLFSFEVLSKVLGVIFHYTQSFSSELLLFITIFFIMAYLRRKETTIFENKLFELIIIVLTWALAIFVTTCYMKGTTSEITPILAIMVSDETSILYIFAGISLFYIFKRIKIGYNKYINHIAGCTFGVLLIHDHNFFREILWKDILCVQEWYSSQLFALYAILCIFGIFIVCVLIDYLRKKLLEEPIFKSKKLQELCKMWDSFATIKY